MKFGTLKRPENTVSQPRIHHFGRSNEQKLRSFQTIFLLRYTSAVLSALYSCCDCDACSFRFNAAAEAVSFAFRAQFKPIRPDLLHAALTKLPDRKFHFLSAIFIYHCAQGKANCAASKAESRCSSRDGNINDSRNGTCNGGKFLLPLRGQGKLARHL